MSSGEADRRRVRTVPIALRDNKVDPSLLASPPGPDHDFGAFLTSLPDTLEVTSTSEDGEIMGVRHRGLAGGPAPLEGVQFHPESILSEHGHAMLRNFLEMTR